MVAVPQLSVTSGTSYQTTIVVAFASTRSDLSEGHWMVGGMRSTTSMVVVQMVLPPVALAVTVAVVSLVMVVPAAGDCSRDIAEQSVKSGIAVMSGMIAPQLEPSVSAVIGRDEMSTGGSTSCTVTWNEHVLMLPAASVAW